MPQSRQEKNLINTIVETRVNYHQFYSQEVCLDNT